MESEVSPGQQLKTDLRLIREARGITIEEIHRSSRIPLEMLHHFERRGLGDHPLFNEVYIRAFIRTYAGAIRVPDDEVLAALEAEQQGRYQGRLAQQYLGWTPPQASVPDTPPDAVAPPPEALPPEVPLPEAPPPVAPPPEAPVHAATPPAIAAASPEPQERPQETVEQGTVAPWMILVLVLVIVVAGLAWFFFKGAPEERLPDEPPARVDVDVPVAAAPVAVALPDTLRLEVLAADGPLRGFRVQFDEDIRRPYWLEQGDTMRIAFVRSAQVEYLAAARYLFEGQPVAAPDADGLISIDRPRAQAFLDSLARANR